jgi:hypothetical protein
MDETFSIRYRNEEETEFAELRLRWEPDGRKMLSICDHIKDLKRASESYIPLDTFQAHDLCKALRPDLEEQRVMLLSAVQGALEYIENCSSHQALTTVRDMLKKGMD